VRSGHHSVITETRFRICLACTSVLAPPRTGVPVSGEK